MTMYSIWTISTNAYHEKPLFYLLAEMDEMETLRLETELEKQRLSMADNRDSAIQDDSNTSTSDLVLRTSNSGK